MTLVDLDSSNTSVAVENYVDVEDMPSIRKIDDYCRNRLMYYLNCFSAVSKFIKEYPKWKKYTKYKEMRKWTIKEEEELYHICRDVITVDYAKANGFVEYPYYILPDNTTNEFFEVNGRSEVIINHHHIYIGGSSVVKNIVMIFSSSWIKKNYKDALKDVSKIIERKKKVLHNKEMIEKNKKYCFVITKRDSTEYPNVIKLVLVLYFIESLALIILYVNTNEKLNADSSSFKWVKLAAIIISIVDSVLAFTAIAFVCTSRCYDNWIAYVRMIVVCMLFFSIASLPFSVIVNSYSVVDINKLLISVVLFCFSCILCKETKVKLDCVCLWCGMIKVSPEKIHHEI